MMRPTDYAQPAAAEAESLIADLFALGGIGYVALGRGQQVLMRAAPGLATDTTSTSNFFEELLVNPTLLALAGQRGGLDCGGLDHIAVGYAGFTQLILRMKDGHVSLGVSRKAPVRELAEKTKALLAARGWAWTPPEATLLA